MEVFHDRDDAGKKLAEKLLDYAGDQDVRVLALPRGGVPVAFQVARILNKPLDVFLVRKLGVPGQEELAMGAIASGGVRVLNHNVIEALGISPEIIEAVATREQKELERRQRVYRGDRPPLDVRGCQVILVDDGLATGASMRAAVTALRALEPARIIVAVPVAPPEVYRAFTKEADEIVSVQVREPFFGVGAWYENFRQVTDEEVRMLLEKAAPTP